MYMTTHSFRNRVSWKFREPSPIPGIDKAITFKICYHANYILLIT